MKEKEEPRTFSELYKQTKEVRKNFILRSWIDAAPSPSAIDKFMQSNLGNNKLTRNVKDAVRLREMVKQSSNLETWNMINQLPDNFYSNQVFKFGTYNDKGESIMVAVVSDSINFTYWYPHSTDHGWGTCDWKDYQILCCDWPMLLREFSINHEHDHKITTMGPVKGIMVESINYFDTLDQVFNFSIEGDEENIPWVHGGYSNVHFYDQGKNQCILVSYGENCYGAGFKLESLHDRAICTIQLGDVNCETKLVRLNSGLNGRSIFPEHYKAIAITDRQRGYNNIDVVKILYRIDTDKLANLGILIYERIVRSAPETETAIAIYYDIIKNEDGKLSLVIQNNQPGPLVNIRSLSDTKELASSSHSFWSKDTTKIVSELTKHVESIIRSPAQPDLEKIAGFQLIQSPPENLGNLFK